ncbi:MAG TPA: AbrB/MazE/SpoVT family DNA-binding domain-containing protein [Rhizobiaceae bacterium]|nr:AbrB/MazE/SpoVT family DNA-binding domain-containing protein [Rhizobiaceae bacterium]
MTNIPIAKWGNSSAIRLPKAVMEELGLKPGGSVNLTVENGKAVLEPVRPKKITLEWIVSEMKRLGPENQPELVDWGPDRGDEIIDDEYSRGEITLDDLLKRR